MMDIPKIIHQTWKNLELPYPFNVLSETWRTLHPEWEYKLWSDEMNREFIRENYPEFLEKYNGYSREIQRVDAFRYLVLYKYGGLYVDVDFECLKSIEPILLSQNCVIGKEPKYHSDRYGLEYFLGNAFMACTPGNDFMKFVCGELMAYPQLLDVTPIEVLKSTGPWLLTDTYREYDNADKVTVLESELIYPLTMHEIKNVYEDKIDVDMQKRIDHAFAIHYFWGGW